MIPLSPRETITVAWECDRFRAMLIKSILYLLLAPYWLQNPPQTPAANTNPNNTPEARARLEAQTVELRAILEKSKKLPFQRAALKSRTRRVRKTL